MKHENLETLKSIYMLYDRQIGKTPVACRKYCADCCSANVTMTRLEGLLILQSAYQNQVKDLVWRLQTDGFERYQPRLSTNAYAEACRANTDTEEGEPQPGAGKCPFLENSECTIYPVRPFGCRCMISTVKCGQNGCAEIDEITLTVNTVFMQFIEHLDQNGFSGNITDVLIHLSAGESRIPGTCRIIPNRPIPALMVPAGHRNRMTGIINDLHRLIAGSKT